jgi:hypothetical protein
MIKTDHVSPYDAFIVLHVTGPMVGDNQSQELHIRRSEVSILQQSDGFDGVNTIVWSRNNQLGWAVSETIDEIRQLLRWGGVS